MRVNTLLGNLVLVQSLMLENYVTALIGNIKQTRSYDIAVKLQ